MAIGNRSDRLRAHSSGHARREPAAYERVAVSPSSAPRPSYRSVFAVAEFRALWPSQILSVGGDRLALVALTLLVYDRTKSPLLAAVAFAGGTLPYIFGALFLSGLADRFPRHVVVWPVKVQGEGSALEVAAAIAGFNALPPSPPSPASGGGEGGGMVPRPDLLIVARGGG